ncbi:MAG TPA: pyridoxal-dependent decarboxylase [Gemmataceae bacterium]|nr:pyridoxal-dependent decarboxylase [Gemmataceae bacterium]
MTTRYHDILDRLRLAFPQPVSDRVHDSYFVHSIMRAIDQVDALKTEIPLLGVAPPNDYAAAQKSRLKDEPSAVEQVTAELVDYLRGMQILGHPRTQQNVTPPPSIPAVIGVLLASLYNPNLGWDEYSRRVALAEVEATAIAADLVGYDPTTAGGVFTFGGTGTTLYGVKLGLEKAWPGTMVNGIQGDAVLFASDVSHYCRFNIAGWLGIGARNIVVIPTGTDNAIDVRRLELEARRALTEGKRIAAFIATMGSTDAFGLDDLESIVALRDRLVVELRLPYRPHVHADAVIGWAWSTFRDYSWEKNPLEFRPRTVRALAGIDRKIRHLGLADSIGIDFHKTGFCPYIASLFLVKDRGDFSLVARTPEMMPYLYHSGEYKPGFFTLETSRSGTGVLAAIANLHLFGKQGWQALLGHLIEMAHLLREHLDGHEATTVLNRQNFGPVTLFRVYPDGVDTFTVQDREFKDPARKDDLLRHNEYNRRIAAYVHEEALAGRGVLISLTECYRQTDYGEPIVAIKSYILSPFVDVASVEVLVEKILEARQKVAMP